MDSAILLKFADLIKNHVCDCASTKDSSYYDESLLEYIHNNEGLILNFMDKFDFDAFNKDISLIPDEIGQRLDQMTRGFCEDGRNMFGITISSSPDTNNGKAANVIREAVVPFVSFTDWLYSKQVFEISDELLRSFDELYKESENIILYPRVFDRLPFRSFVLTAEFEDNKGVMVINDLLVSVFSISDGYVLAITIVDAITEGAKDSTTSLVWINNDMIDEKGEYIIDTPEIQNVEEGDSIQTVKYWLNTVMQTCMYLASLSPDVIQAEETKNTYKPGKVIHNKYRELRKWDVGFRYAESIKKHNFISTNESTGTGTSKRPHVRRAHWHKYWVGKGRETLEIKWVNQCMVNATFDSDLPVVGREE